MTPGLALADGAGSAASANVSAAGEAGYEQSPPPWRTDHRSGHIAASTDCQTQDPTEGDPTNATQCDRSTSFQFDVPMRPVHVRCTGFGCEIHFTFPSPFSDAQLDVETTAGEVHCATGADPPCNVTT